MNEPEWNEYLAQFDLDTFYFQKITNQTNKFCVIVEPRIDKKLILVIKNFMYLLQEKGWGLIIFHGTQNEQFLRENLNGWSSSVIYIQLGIPNMTTHQYSDLLCSPSFWKTLLDNNCEHALIFQMDTVLLKDDMDEFMQYDYIGAPWWIKFMGCLEIGNGGLSLRKTNIMHWITNNKPRFLETTNGVQRLEIEDIYFSYWLLQMNANVPSIPIAKRFSVETIISEDTCGMHQPHLDKFPNRDVFVKLLQKRWIM